jgi:hypothetical protein
MKDRRDEAILRGTPPSWRLPHEQSSDGRRLFRPAQLAVIARARRVRFHTDQA